MDEHRDELVTAHLWLVERAVDRRMRSLPTWVERDELVAYGYLALVQAAERFDPSLGVPFPAYARIRVDGAIRDSLRAGDWLPTRLRAAQRRISAVQRDLATASHPTPDPTAVAAAAGITVAELQLALQQAAAADLVSLDAGRTGEDDAAVSRHHEEQPEDALIDECMIARMRSLIRRLSEKQRVALVGSYLEGRTGVELAELLGVSPSRVSQLRNEALLRLRDWLDSAPDRETTGGQQPT